jgi:RHS repeat-associated protein
VTTSVPEHSAETGQRGNLTTLTQSFSTGGSLVTAAAYEDTGNAVSVTGPNGLSTYAYDAATHTFTTTATPPTPSSGVSLASTATYDPNSSLPLTATDPNSQTVTYKSYDPLYRPTEIDYPDGGKMTASYTPNSTGVYQYMTGSTHTNTQTSLETYGRLNWVAVENATGGYYWNNYCYDGNGNVSFAAYRFTSGTITCSGAGDTYSYDTLGRVLTITHGDGSKATYSYNGRATEVTDENGASRVVQVDGLGRPIAVCEISGSTLEGVAPAACGLDITGTGFLTTYAYSTDTSTSNGLKTVVYQGAQTRTFEADWLGRTTIVTEPESSTRTYSYAYSTGSGLGLTVIRKRPTANQANPSNLTTTTTQYDSLGRVVSVTYTDGTPAKSFTYDAPSNWAEASQQTNLKGRLSSHSRTTGAGGAGSIFGYDAMGRVTLQYSCLPSGCGNAAYDKEVAYTYNTAGMLTSEGDGAGDTYTYSRSIAGEITGITDSFSDATDPANIIAPGSVQNGPFGPTTYNLGNGLTAVNSYDTLGRVSGGWVCAGSSQPSCTGGTQQVYGYTAVRLGTHVTQTCDTVLDVCNSFGYDEFDRLTARTVTQGTVQNFTYGYDRYGNRWTQNAPQGGPSLSISFNQGNNIISTSGFANDVVGNVTGDTFHSYSYDADGNLISVDSGATATYYYDSLNQRVRIAPTRGTYEFVWDVFGRRVSNWAAASHGFVESNAYTDSAPIAFRIGGQTEFEHQNWLGTERVRTTYNGGVAISIASLPWADGHTPSGDNGDQHDFALMDRDLEDNSEHAQYRQFSTNVGRWMSPDLYQGSYDFTNPQSFNRYSYALNDPANMLDPSGLAPTCVPDPDTDSIECTSLYVSCDTDPSAPGCSVGGGGVGSPSSCLTLYACAGLVPSGPGKPTVAPNNTEQEAQCLSQYNNSAAGKATQFLSLYNLATNLNSVKTWAEWTALPYLKVQAANLLSKGAQAIGSTEFLSITSGGATTIVSPTAAGISLSESVGAVAAPMAIGAATVVDAQVHSACAGNAPTVELAPTVF